MPNLHQDRIQDCGEFLPSYQFRPDDWWKHDEEGNQRLGYYYAERTESPLELEFRSLASAWKSETGEESSLSKITSNINYLRVIALGKAVVPLILKELESEPAPWFVALRALTGNFDVGAQHKGNFRKIADCWIEWGARNKY